MKIYVGAWRRDRGAVTVTDDNGTRSLPPRNDLRDHSPGGFAWGYSGSGPAQLAIAICADVLGDDDRAQRVYQLVKEALIAPITADDWTLNEDQVRAAIARAEAK